MKKTFVVVGLLLYMFVAFRPPAGMRKFPTANIEFQAEVQNASYTASAK